MTETVRPAGPPAPPERARNVLIVSASMGAGHDTVAAELARRARARGAEAQVADVLRLLPYGLGAALRAFYEGSVRHFPWAYAGLYDVFLRPGPGRRPDGTPLARLAADRLIDLVESTGAEVVVPVFHLAAQLTGHLRAKGALAVPSAVFVVDFAVHRQWLHPGNDLYVCVTDEVAREARAALGRPAETTGPVAPPAFADAPARAADWHRRFERHAPGRDAVLLSTGSWGVGSRVAATARLLAAHGHLPVVLCGSNARLRRTLSSLPGVLALGWVADMPGLLGAARVLVDNAAGQTAAQALAVGLPVVGYRPLPGHGADGVRRMAALGLSDLVPDASALLRSLDRLAAPGPVRDHRVAAGRALFRADPLSCAMRLAAGGSAR